VFGVGKAHVSRAPVEGLRYLGDEATLHDEFREVPAAVGRLARLHLRRKLRLVSGPPNGDRRFDPKGVGNGQFFAGAIEIDAAHAMGANSQTSRLEAHESPCRAGIKRVAVRDRLRGVPR